MSNFPDFLRSLLLTMIFSFLTPVILIAGGLMSFTVISYLPHLATVGQFCSQQILQFLTIFGNGDPIAGSLTIGVACSFVGALFDSYAFCHNQRIHSSR